MNLTTLKQFLKKAWPFVLILFLIFIVFLLLYITVASKKPSPTTAQVPTPVIEQNPLQKAPQSIDTSQASSLAVPGSLPFYSAQKLVFNDQQVQDIAGKFSISQKPTITQEKTYDGKQYTWIEKTKTLSISDTAISYKDTSNTAGNSNLSLSELENKAQESIKSLGIINGVITLDNQNTAYLAFSNGSYTSASSFDEAQIISLYFNLNLSGYPIFYNTPNPSLINIMMKKDGQVASFNARFFSGFKQAESYKIKPYQQALSELKGGQGKLVNTLLLDDNNQSVDESSIRPVDIQKADIKKSQIAYFLPTDSTSAIQPVFVFTGEFTINNQKGRAIFYLPAAQGLKP